MIIEQGMKIHVMYRALFENTIRRHFAGEVVAAEGSTCRLEGFAFVLDPITGNYSKRQRKRVSVFDLAESGYIVNIIDSNVDLQDLAYKYLFDKGMVVTDDKDFILNISEFGPKQ